MIEYLNNVEENLAKDEVDINYSLKDPEVLVSKNEIFFYIKYIF
jgi:hypothetical protein